MTAMLIDAPIMDISNSLYMNLYCETYTLVLERCSVVVSSNWNISFFYFFNKIVILTFIDEIQQLSLNFIQND